MRIRLAIAATALVAGLTAAPATADAQQRYQHSGYERQYDRHDNYGYRGDVRQLRYQVQEMRRDIAHFDRRGMLTNREARKLDRQAGKLLQRIHRMSYRGLNRGEYRSAQQGIANLQRAIRHDLRDRGNGRDDRRWREHRGDRDDRYDRRRDRRGRY